MISMGSKNIGRRDDKGRICAKLAIQAIKQVGREDRQARTVIDKDFIKLEKKEGGIDRGHRHS